MNDLTPQQLREQLLAGMPEAPEVGDWPTQIGERIAVRRRRANALRVTAAVAVLAFAAGLMVRAVSLSGRTEAVVSSPQSASVAAASGPSSSAPSTSPTAPAPTPTASSQVPTALPNTTTPTVAPSSSVTGTPQVPSTESPCQGKDPVGDNPATIATGARALWWCTPTNNSLGAPLEALAATAASQVAARYNSLANAPATPCTPDPGATYWLVFVYPNGTQVTLNGDFSHCNRIGVRNDSRSLTTALGAAFDAQRAGGYPEVDVVANCQGNLGVPGTDSFLAIQPNLLAFGYRCQKGKAIELPADLVNAMAAGLTSVPSDQVFDPQDDWLVAYTVAGDPLHLWVLDGRVWAQHLTVSGDPRSAEYLGWEPTPEQLAVLLGR